MKKIIIISGHGHFATGLQSSIELLAGENEELYYIDFTIDDTNVTLHQKMDSILHKNSDAEVLFICDILGGTPFKVAAEIANDNGNMEVVVGCNIGSIIESIFKKDDYSISELSEFIVDASKKSTMKFNKVTSNKINDDLEIEDGI